MVLIVAEILAKARRRLPMSFATTMPCSPRRTADLIDEPDAVGNQATPNPMNRLHPAVQGT